MESMITEKKHKKNEFYVKPIRGGYFMVVNSYDYSMESLENNERDAIELCNKLNKMRTSRLKLG